MEEGLWMEDWIEEEEQLRNDIREVPNRTYKA